jgi:hypothetical protein
MRVYSEYGGKNMADSGKDGLCVRKRVLVLLLAVATIASALLPMVASTGDKAQVASISPLDGALSQSIAGEPPIVNTIVIQPNYTVGKDAYIENFPGNQWSNWGGNGGIHVGNDTGPSLIRSLVQFDLPPVVGRLLDATLYTYHYYNASGGLNLSVRAITSTWTEWGVSWMNRSNGTAWTTPGGDFNTTFVSWRAVKLEDAWSYWNVSRIVEAWMSGALINNGFLFSGLPYALTTGHTRFWSSDTNSVLAPKLVIKYSVSFDRTIPPQTMQEDGAPRTISLEGMSNGTILHQNGTPEMTTSYPFGLGPQMHYQLLFNKSQVGGEGVIRRFSLNRTSSQVGNYSNFRIYMAHTNRTQLSDTFANNNNGTLIEVFRADNLVVNSSNGDTWIHFDLTGNFTYDGHHNLVIDIQWVGWGGSPVILTVYSGAIPRRLWSTTGAATGTLNNNPPQTMFQFDAVNNAVVDDGKIGWNLPFSTNWNQLRLQELYNYTYLNQSGVIDKLNFHLQDNALKNTVLQNFSIRLAHSSNDTLDANFNMHAITPWVEVFNRTSYNVIGNPNFEWITFDVDDTFTYNGIDNLLVDIRHRGVGNPGVNMFTYINWTTVGDFTIWGGSYAASTGTPVTYRHNMQFIFTESANLTWSATSSNTTLFSAGISGTNLVITPQPDRFGSGTATLTLHNSNGATLSQSIPVTIMPVNDPPALSAIPDLQCVEDVDKVLSMVSYVTDIDDPIANLTFTTTSAYAAINGTNITFNYPEGILVEYVNITVHDKGGLSATSMMIARVTPVNDPPYLDSFVDALTCDATIPKKYVVDPMDEETPPCNLTFYVDSQYAVVEGCNVTFTYPKGVGVESVDIFVVDENIYGSQNNRSYVLNVHIVDHPDVTTMSPEGTGVAVTTNIVATFDMAMNTTTVEGAFSLKLGATNINGTFSWSTDNKTVTFTPSGHLTNGVYDVRIGTGAKNAVGAAMLAAEGWNFTAALGSFDGDGDGMPDQWEMDNGLDPDADDADLDRDGDGMPNFYEYENDLNPQVNDAEADADGDGYSNFDEFEAGTDPQDPDDKPSEIPWMLMIIVVVIIVVVILVVALMLRKKKGQEPESSYKEFRELKPEVPQEGGPGQSPPQQPPQGGSSGQNPP